MKNSDQANRSELILKVTLTSKAEGSSIFTNVYQQVEVIEQLFDSDQLYESHILHKSGLREYQGGVAISNEPVECLTSLLLDYRNKYFMQSLPSKSSSEHHKILQGLIQKAKDLEIAVLQSEGNRLPERVWTEFLESMENALSKFETNHVHQLFELGDDHGFERD